MLQRIVTGLVLAPLAVYTVLWAPKVAMLAVLVLAAPRCAVELVRMFAPFRPGDRLVVAVLVAAIAGSPLLGWPIFALVLTLATVLWLAACLVEPGDLPVAAQRAALGALALVYVGALVAMLVACFAVQRQAAGQPFFDTGRAGLLGILVTVFMGDTGAYFAGKAFGRNKLYPLISPKKTVEGGVGGLLASIGGGLIFAVWLLPGTPLVQGAVLGAACGIFGQVGDFAESLFKRASGVKDSGALLPGHGGLLDRVDGVLFAAPVMYAWLTFAG